MPISIYPPPNSSAQNTAGFVDVSWLREQGARGVRKQGKDMGLNAQEVCQWLQNRRWLNHQYLGTYFYEAQYEDGDPNRTTQRTYLDAIADTSGVHLRLGHLIHRNDRLQQKGVDSLIVLDMLLLAQQGAYDSAILTGISPRPSGQCRAWASGWPWRGPRIKAWPRRSDSSLTICS